MGSDPLRQDGNTNIIDASKGSDPFSDSQFDRQDVDEK